MTERQKKKEINFATACMIEQFDDMLKAGEITQQRHDEIVAKVKGA